MQMNALLGRLVECGEIPHGLLKETKEVNFAICNGLKFQETLRGNGSVFLNILTFTKHVCI
jgi:hypothetical protein